MPNDNEPTTTEELEHAEAALNAAADDQAKPRTKPKPRVSRKGKSPGSKAPSTRKAPETANAAPPIVPEESFPLVVRDQGGEYVLTFPNERRREVAVAQIQTALAGAKGTRAKKIESNEGTYWFLNVLHLRIPVLQLDDEALKARRIMGFNP